MTEYLFQVGDRVEITRGPHAGERGWIAKVEPGAGPFEAEFLFSHHPSPDPQPGIPGSFLLFDDMMRKLSLLEIIAEAAA